MEDILLLRMLKEKGLLTDKDYNEHVEKFVMDNFAKDKVGVRRDSQPDDFMTPDHYNKDLDMYKDFYVNRHSDNQLKDIVKSLDANDKKKLMEMMLGTSMVTGSHFNEDHAKYIVSTMFHSENGRKYMGEKYDMVKAKEVCERYRGIIPQFASHADVYVAINTTYHDYCELYKAWFGESIDSKIIESSIHFWFKDEDWDGSCKIHEYFVD